MVMVIMIMVVATKDDDDHKVEQDDLDFSTLPLVGTIPVKSIFSFSTAFLGPRNPGVFDFGDEKESFFCPYLD